VTHILRNFTQIYNILYVLSIYFLLTPREAKLCEILNFKVCKIGLSNCYIEITDSEIYTVISMGIFQEINISESVHICPILHIDYTKKINFD